MLNQPQPQHAIMLGALNATQPGPLGDNLVDHTWRNASYRDILERVLHGRWLRALESQHLWECRLSVDRAIKEAS